MKVLTFADLHLRSTVPSCIDSTQSEWMATQKEALNKVLEIAVDNNVEYILVGGDIFHSEQTASFECIYMFQEFAAEAWEKNIKVRIIAGNHDLPGHSSSNISKSAIGVLMGSRCIGTMKSEATSPVWGCNFDDDNYYDYKYIFKHVLCIPKENKPEYVDCETPEILLDKYPFAEIIFTGDYHRNFLYVGNGKYKGRYVVNSGCLTKQASDLENYETGVYVTDLEKKEIRWFKIDVCQKFVKNAKVAVDESMMDFVNGIKREMVTLDFVGTLKNQIQDKDEGLKKKVNSWIEEIGQ